MSNTTPLINTSSAPPLKRYVSIAAVQFPGGLEVQLAKGLSSHSYHMEEAGRSFPMLSSASVGDLRL